MEITPFMVYAIGILDSVIKFFGMFGFIFGLCCMITLIIKGIGCVEGSFKDITHKALTKFIISFGIICVCCLSCNAFLPSSKLAASMFLIPAIANNENVQSIGSNTLKSLEMLTEQWLEDIAKNKEIIPNKKHTGEHI